MMPRLSTPLLEETKNNPHFSIVGYFYVDTINYKQYWLNTIEET